MNTPIYVINLDQDADRLELMRKRLYELNLSFERFSAYLGKNIPENLHREFFYPDGSIFGHLNDGEVGCYASHLNCMKKFLETECPSAIILEDDVDFHPEFPQILTLLHKLNVRYDWDILRLSNFSKYSYVSVESIKLGIDLVKYSKIPIKAGGYFITRNGAQKFSAYRGYRLNSIDIDMRYAWERGLITYGINPPIVLHVDRFPSTIDRIGLGRRTRRKSLFRFLFQLKQRVSFNIRTLSFSLWISCFLRNFYIQIYRRFAQRVPDSLKRINVKSDIR